MRAAIYTRVSSAEQVKGHSLAGQRAILEAWADREGWEVVARYEDAGFSAKNVEGRPAFMRMLAEVATFDVLLVLKQDRFARDLADAFLAERTLQRAGARVLYHDEPGANDSDTPAGLIVKAVGYAGAQGYRMDLSRKIARGYAHMATVKGLHVGDVPFGYRRPDPKQPMEVDEHEAAGVVWAFETYASGNDSLAAIADELAARGYRPHSRGEARRDRTEWAISTVASMLKNRIYLGDILYRGEYFPGQHAPIITPALFSRVRLAAERRKRSPRTHARVVKNVYMVTGIGECARCLSPLWGDRSGSGYLSYRCSSRHSRRDCEDRRRGIRAERVEDRVERAIVVTAAQLEGLAGLIAEEIALVRPPVDADAQRERLEGIIRRASKLMLAGGDEGEALRAIRDANLQLAALDAAPRSEPAVEALSDFGALWPHFTAAERREAAQIVFQAVSVSIGSGDVFVLPRPEYAAAYNAAATAGGGSVSHLDGKVVMVRPGGLGRMDTAAAVVGSRWLRVS